MGPVLDPWSGAWAVAARAGLPEEGSLSLPGLAGPVRVIYDDRAVPHIFASSTEDAARALGYVVARERLFQMEMRWRSTAGRMSEMVGAAGLEFDRYMRGLGLAWSAERDFVELDRASETFRQLTAYAEGVNAWIDGMSRRDLPLEYRVLGVRPSRWEPVYSVYFLKLMGWDLTYGAASDLRRLRVAAKVGEEAARALLPVNSPIQQPIQPNGSTSPRFDFAVIAPPGEPDPAAADLARALQVALGPLADDPEAEAEAPLGSNNWAVAPERTESGYALLAGDPHLGLALPSIWYEAHLVVPGELDVYGATMPSAPAVVIGFNRDVAWSFTNTGADVIDYYVEEVDDREQPRRYLVDGEWRPLELRVEEYRVRGGDLWLTDTLFATHRGPVIDHDDRMISMRWTVLEGSDALHAFLAMDRASSVEESFEVVKSFAAPAQNMVVADRNGRIGIVSTGHFPLQPSGAGLEVRDGRTSQSDWVDFWPPDRFPQSVDPRQGYLASANQQPIDPLVDDTYMGADWPSPWRAMRINGLLAADSAVTPDAMRRYQTDPGNARADLFLSFFLDAVARQEENGGLDARASEAAGLLSEWDRRYTKGNQRAVLFEAAMDELADRTWDELLSSPEPNWSRRVFTPASAVLASLLHQPESAWWDDRRTAVREDRDAILVASLAKALETTTERYGEPEQGGWRWDGIRHANVYHLLLNQRSLSARDLPVQGGPGNLNPSSGGGSHGSSWRMVVQLGPEIQAWTIYPGGQSGNPVSPYYRDRIEKWVNGELEPVLFPRDSSDLDPARTRSNLELSPER
jgi:penicillin amidase